MPPYDPAAWNDADGIQFSNNCYDYCRDEQSGNFTQPGEQSGWVLASDPYACNQVGDAAEDDGLTRSDRDSDCGDPRWKVALVIDPDPADSDFHWYRQDDNGYWSHKPGSTPVRNIDEAGNPIEDPQEADRGSYTEFCGYFCTAAPNDSGMIEAMTAKSEPSEPTAHLLLYSGRDNPAMPLDRSQVEEVAGRLEGLTPRSESPEGGLGYAGILVESPGGGALPREFRVYKATVTVTTEPNKTSIYNDDKQLEEWLLQLFKEGPAWTAAAARIAKTVDPGPAAVSAIERPRPA
jgi:hypothetical protein